MKARAKTIMPDSANVLQVKGLLRNLEFMCALKFTTLAEFQSFHTKTVQSDGGFVFATRRRYSTALYYLKSLSTEDKKPRMSVHAGRHRHK